MMQSYYRNMPSVNPLVTERLYVKQLEKHYKKLENVSCSIDTKPPTYWSGKPRRNIKRDQQREELYSSIERENKQLLERVTQIMLQPGPSFTRSYSGIKSFQLKSLNHESRKRHEHQVTVENQQILGRILHSQPTYKHTDWEQSRLAHEGYLRNLVRFRSQPLVPIAHLKRYRPKTTSTGVSARNRHSRRARRTKGGRSGSRPGTVPLRTGEESPVQDNKDAWKPLGSLQVQSSTPVDSEEGLIKGETGKLDRVSSIETDCANNSGDLDEGLDAHNTEASNFQQATEATNTNSNCDVSKEMPSPNSPDQSIPVDEAPVDETSVDGTPVEVAPVDETPVEVAPAGSKGEGATSTTSSVDAKAKSKHQKRRKTKPKQ